MRSVQEMMVLDGRTAVVTGGAGHLGEAICEALAELGANVAVVDKDESKARDRAEEIADLTEGGTLAISADLTDSTLVEDVRGPIIDRFGGVDVVVNAAALVGTDDLDGWSVSFEEQAIENFEPTFRTNVTPIFDLVQGLIDPLREGDAGSVINVASTYGLVGPDPRLYQGTEMGNPAAYAASKGAVLQLTRWLSTMLAPEVRVNAVTPGGIERDQPERFQEAYRDRTPLDRMAVEEDLKGAIAYLATDLSSYVTGENLVVDGGWTAW